jgi:diguanylate cyclase (GGDEF)-like protein
LLQKLSVVPVVENFQTVFRNPKSEKTFWLDISARVIDFDNEVALFSAFKDITAQKKHEQDLFEKAVLDPLTGCYNRRQFLELAMKEIRRAWRYDAPFCLMMMDIDHFKMVNDRYGHTFGDEVLKIMARACKQNLRDSDIFARYGGEEFIVLLTNTTIAEGRSVAERVRQAIEKCVISLTTGEKFHFTISLGVVCSQSSDDLDELVKRADSALYAAKKGGRNQVRIYGEQENFTEVKNATLNDLSAEDYSKKIIQQKKSDS